MTELITLIDKAPPVSCKDWNPIKHPASIYEDRAYDSGHHCQELQHCGIESHLQNATYVIEWSRRLSMGCRTRHKLAASIPGIESAV